MSFSGTTSAYSGKFKVGDKVRVLPSFTVPEYSFMVGEIYTVKSSVRWVRKVFYTFEEDPINNPDFAILERCLELCEKEADMIPAEILDDSFCAMAFGGI